MPKRGEYRIGHEVDAVSGCWVWQGSLHPKGYGNCTRVFEGRRIEQAHRWYFLQYVGTIPAGMFVCHHCDNPPCVNPTHLFLGTQIDNVRDMLDKGRHAYGLRHRGAKLSPTAAADIRARVERGEKQAHLAVEYGVCVATLNQVVKNRTWKEAA